MAGRKNGLLSNWGLWGTRAHSKEALAGLSPLLGMGPCGSWQWEGWACAALPASQTLSWPRHFLKERKHTAGISYLRANNEIPPSQAGAPQCIQDAKGSWQALPRLATDPPSRKVLVPQG